MLKIMKSNESICFSGGAYALSGRAADLLILLPHGGIRFLGNEGKCLVHITIFLFPRGKNMQKT